MRPTRSSTRSGIPACLLTGLLAALVVQACDDRAASSSAGGPSSAQHLLADATVGAATDAAQEWNALDSAVPVEEAGAPIGPPPGAILSPGPDGAAPVACDLDAAAGTQCKVAPSDCNDGGGVYYSGGWCIDGTCEWQTSPLQCASTAGDSIPGASCAPPGSPAAAGPFLDDSGAWFVSVGCRYPIVGPPPPQVACDADGGADAGGCALPRSVCATGSWLIYFDQGECVSGQCQWQKQYASCPYGCSNGACGGLPTAQ
jgi:hypothetical protein